MSEEAKVEEVVEEVVEPSAVEVQATGQGWMPKDRWESEGKDPAEWRPAKEFVDRGELFKTIHSTKRDLKQTQSALSALQKHHQFVFEKAHKQALEDLKQEKRQAMKAEDLERVQEIDEKIDEQREKFATEKAELVAQTQPVQAAIVPEFELWKETNQWYGADEEASEFAEATGFVYMKKNPGAAPETVLKHIETKVRKQFPEKFGVRKAAPSPTVGSDKTSVRKPKADDIELDAMEKDIMKTLVDSGVLTAAEYKAELKKAKGTK